MAHVLTIHTNPSVRSALAARLAAEGHTVSEQPHLHSSGSVRSEGEPDLVLLEHEVEGVPAHELLPTLRSDAKNAPVIVLAVPPERVLRTLREGAYFCTREPLDLDEVAVL